MNGRIYDPTLGRMLQADPIADPGSQGLNRYSYVANNPLTLTDPSGYSWFSNILRAVVGVAIAIWAPELLEPYLGTFGSVVGAGFLAGYVSTGSVQGALVGAFSGAALFGIGSYFQSAGWAYDTGSACSASLTTAGLTARSVAMGVEGGVMSSLQGGKFGSGFASAGLASALSPVVGNIHSAPGQIVASSVIGGTVSEVSGGKFANGAVTGAFTAAFGLLARGGGKNSFTQRMNSVDWSAAGQVDGYSLAFELPLAPPWLVSGAAGFGDTISMGLSGHIRDLWDIDGGVDSASDAYRYGGNAAVATSLLGGAGIFRGAFTLGSAATVTRWGGEGAWVMMGEQSTSSWWLSGTRFMYSYDTAVTSEVAAARLSYPPGWEWVKGLFGQRVIGP